MEKIRTKTVKSKKYYSIGEVADILSVNTSKIRFWEGEFDHLNVKKNSAGERRFTNDNIEQLRIIHHLREVENYSIQGARDAIQKNGTSLKEKLKTIESLKKIKSFLVTLKDQI